MKKTLICTACVAALSSSSALAQGEGTSQLEGCVVKPEEKVTNIYFANGVGNDDTAANLSVGYLRNLYWAILRNLNQKGKGRYGTFDFLLAYNPTINPFYDVVEVLNQKAREQGVSESLSGLQILRLIQGGLNSEEFRVAVKLAMRAALNPTPLTGMATNLVLDELFDYASDQISKAQADAIKNIPEVEALHTNMYTSALRAGKRVFVIAHSQGNLFTNASLAAAAIAQPDEADSLAMIGVATPARLSNQFKGGQAQVFYRTAHDDAVIDSLRITDNVAPSNIENDLIVGFDFARSLSNHAFISDYMWSGLPSEEDNTAELQRLFVVVPFPLRYEENAIRASLTWDSNPPDFDLHAFEPNSSHVYYKRFNGSLDVDDRNGNGPENYVVACDEIEPGTYSIGVNYYAGEGPGSATVNLSLGDGTTSQKRVAFTEAAGRAGNIPDPIFTIRVNERFHPYKDKKIATYKIVE